MEYDDLTEDIKDVVDSCGLDVAKRLINSRLKGSYIYIPNGKVSKNKAKIKQKEEILNKFRSGIDIPAIAKDLRIAENKVYRVIRKSLKNANK